MEKVEIIQKLTENHRSFSEYIAGLNESDFLFSQPGKWNAGQQLDHIIRSTLPLVLAFKLPGFVLRLLFGRPNRPSSDYGALIKKYRDLLGKGGRATGSYVPKMVGYAQTGKQNKRLQRNVTRLCKSLEQYTEDDLDQHLLPHPILGKLTLREMLYFTVYHAEHHHKIAFNNIALKSA